MDNYLGQVARKAIIIIIAVISLSTADSFFAATQGYGQSLFGVLFGPREDTSSPHKTIKYETLTVKTSTVGLVEHGGDLVDNESSGAYNCLICHDGISAKAVGHQIRDGYGEKTVNPIGSHSIEINYPTSSKYVQPYQVTNQGLRLPGGKLTCVTCHNLSLVSKNYYLPVDISKSKLCFACHII